MTEPTEPTDVEGVPEGDKQFHGWRLLGYIFLVVLVIAIVAAVIDWAVIGPLEGRVF